MISLSSNESVDSELPQQETQSTAPFLVEVHSVRASETPDVFEVDCTVNYAGELDRSPYWYSESDPYVLPSLKQWFIDNAGQFEILPYEPPPPEPPRPYSLSVTTLWSRMTDEEAETFDEAMSTASPLRLRKAFNAAQSMMSDSELFTFTRGVLVGALDETRADAILAKESMARPADGVEAVEGIV